MARKKKEEELNPSLDYSQEIGGELEVGAGVQENQMYSELIKQLFDDEKIDVKTDLSQNEIVLLSCLSIMADEFELEILHRFMKLYKRLKLSKNRKSRGEAVEIFRTIGGGNRENEKRGLFDRAMGKEW